MDIKEVLILGESSSIVILPSLVKSVQSKKHSPRKSQFLPLTMILRSQRGKNCIGVSGEKKLPVGISLLNQYKFLY